MIDGHKNIFIYWEWTAQGDESFCFDHGLDRGLCCFRFRHQTLNLSCNIQIYSLSRFFLSVLGWNFHGRRRWICEQNRTRVVWDRFHVHSSRQPDIEINECTRKDEKNPKCQSIRKIQGRYTNRFRWWSSGGKGEKKDVRCIIYIFKCFLFMPHQSVELLVWRRLLLLVHMLTWC